MSLQNKQIAMICGRKIADIKGNRSDGTASVYIVTCLDITQCNSQMIIIMSGDIYICLMKNVYLQ